MEEQVGKSGFVLACTNKDFKCAFITKSSQYLYGQVRVLKRHNESDEVFALISGEATLLTANAECSEYETTVLKTGVAYCVKAGIWHHLAVSEDALVFVVENSAVSKVNTDEVSIEEHQIWV